jgi:3(or 17)beta-hydroxysteroid dehydrogenase
MDKLAGRIALVTGAGSGLGAADCEILAQAGAHVIVTDVVPAAAKQVAKGIGDRATPVTLDVADEVAWAAAAKSVEKAYGRLDILVNNAGICLVGNAETQTLEQFRRTQAVMNEGVFLGCKVMLPLLRRSGRASIINIGSIASMRGYADVLAYAAAKGAVSAMTKAISAMCQDKGYKIRCNSVHPGDIETPMQRHFEGRPNDPRIVPQGILRKGSVGAPIDVAAMVLFLASDDSRFVTGAEFVVDNGASIRTAW